MQRGSHVYDKCVFATLTFYFLFKVFFVFSWMNKSILTVKDDETKDET